jgi:putative ABC transport system permease protein
VVRSVRGMPGIAQAANVTYFTMQVRGASGADTRAMVVGIESGQPGEPGYLMAGRHLTRSHYEAVADIKTGFALGERIQIRRHDYTVVGLTRRMVSSGGDPMVFVALKDAQEAQFLKDNDAIVNDRVRTAANPAFNRPGVPGLLDAVQASQASSRNVNAILVQLTPGVDAETAAEPIRRWKHLQVYTRAGMEEILVAKLIATSAKQIGMFLVILAIVSAAIVAFIIYTMTLGKIREIAVLKLIGTRNFTIASMILQQAMGLGLIGFLVGKVAATVWAPVFPKFVLLLTQDAVNGLLVTMVICALASTLAIRAALQVDPAEAIG